MATGGKYAVIIVLSWLLFLLPSVCACGRCPGNDSLLVMFWNLENFFDWRDSGTSGSDREFSSFGERHWTKGRFYAKCNAAAKAILWTGSKYGRMPDVVGVAEVENRFVVNSLVKSTALRKYGYETVHYDSPDRRGIDVALAYRKSVFEKVLSRPVRVSGDSSAFVTRDILHVALKHCQTGVTWHFLVNHHPSKYGGALVSGPRRRKAMDVMLSVCDSICSAHPDAGLPGPDGDGPRIVCMGDFNDTPDSPLFGFDASFLVNKAECLHQKGEGTIRYEGKREMIDMFIVSPHVAENSEMIVLKIPFLTVPDNAHSGEKPFRTYSGPKYIGGVSDHCPILLKIKIDLSMDIGIFGR
ncbi:MAG: hypothetical protein IAC07_04525 [Bacteroidetes bacterium]|uniref:Endonuclease/exonuclease/phosphatase domain-containing protein n=1 Tax=Candidatus Cryptobacteroides gallistercoris TaxID=2840765 RepID=A0A940DP67_9BACT|nr:hypothetical protein [Candidatus Cryptobacteroides gallistercoris]